MHSTGRGISRILVVVAVYVGINGSRLLDIHVSSCIFLSIILLSDHLSKSEEQNLDQVSKDVKNVFTFEK